MIFPSAPQSSIVALHRVRSHPYTLGRSPYAIHSSSITVVRCSMAAIATFLWRVHTVLGEARMVVQRLPYTPSICNSQICRGCHCGRVPVETARASLHTIAPPLGCSSCTGRKGDAVQVLPHKCHAAAAWQICERHTPRLSAGTTR